MKGMLENHPLFLSVFICIAGDNYINNALHIINETIYAGVIVAAWEMIPQLNDIIQLAPFPDDNFRYKVCDSYYN